MKAEFKISLLREKFSLRERAQSRSKTGPTIALSNRMVLPLSGPNAENREPETYIIRAQNMHSCVRLTAAIAKEYMERGAIMKRVTPFRWNHLWDDVVKGYELDWNPDIWCAIYYKGRVIFEYGERHALLDIIEQCDALNADDYSHSVLFAEDAFNKAGKAVKIEHESNIALVLTITDEEARCGVILRGAHQRRTFNYNIKKKAGGEIVRVPTILSVSSAFLEGIQLAFTVGYINRKREMELLEQYSDEDRKGRRGYDRLLNLIDAIETVERKYTVTYRPERPDFIEMVHDAEEVSIKMLKEQVHRQARDREIDRMINPQEASE